MSTPTLETLPLIALDRICECLVESDPKRHSIHAFSLASRRCCSAVSLQRFNKIHLAVWSRSRLQADLCRWNEILRPDNRFRYVRELKVSGNAFAFEGDEEEAENLRERSVGYRDREIQAMIDMHECCSPPNIPKRYAEDTSPSSQHGVQLEAWGPLAHFIGQLSGLGDLLWCCGSKMPRNILSAVHGVGCRLHMSFFRLHSLIQDRHYPRDVDPDEFALATSPSLYSIFVPFYDYDTYGRVDYNGEAALRMVAGAAPNLAHVWMQLTPPGDSLDFRNAYGAPRPTWSGFFPKTTTTDQRNQGNLQSLVLSDGTIYPGHIENWSRHTNFAKLRHLVIYWVYATPGVAGSLHCLAEMASHGHFESLHTLKLQLPDEYCHRTQEGLTLFFENLNPLEKLDLNGYISNEAFKTALGRHGSTLKRLSILSGRRTRSEHPQFVFSHVEIQYLVGQCPNLEHLEFPVNRTQGDADETAIYRELSNLPRLEYVSLRLQFSLAIEQLEEEKEMAHFADLRRSFINSAVDSSLVLSIFNTISPSRKLRYLGVNNWVDLDTPTASIAIDPSNIFSWLGRNWACERDDQGDISVRGLDKEDKFTDLEYIFEDYYIHPYYVRVWNSIWPQKTSRWWESWKSLPLSTQHSIVT
ncbi:hypothetical protein GQX73_g10708 [Xylaria multiplex]|uniref:Uncharacterized protein n=1 Tax=Xylaria multiplex TaxID=323545 RepID=A0A7C8IJ47_9PEZI|nr:hypothetical protein GQX73_g10708 [Xylaria multiplex]